MCKLLLTERDRELLATYDARAAKCTPTELKKLVGKIDRERDTKRRQTTSGRATEKQLRRLLAARELKRTKRAAYANWMHKTFGPTLLETI